MPLNETLVDRLLFNPIAITLLIHEPSLLLRKKSDSHPQTHRRLDTLFPFF